MQANSGQNGEVQPGAVSAGANMPNMNGNAGAGLSGGQQGPGELSAIEPGYGLSGQTPPSPQPGGYPQGYPSEADMNTPAAGAAAGWNNGNQ